MWLCVFRNSLRRARKLKEIWFLRQYNGPVRFRQTLTTSSIILLALAVSGEAAPPAPPAPSDPADGATLAVGSPLLSVEVFDPDAQALTVRFFGRLFATPPPKPFTIAALPDTQYYSQNYPATFTAQTRWIVENRDEWNIVYVAHEGDIVNVGDNSGQWVNANTALSLLDALPEVALGLAVGNHDQNPNGDPAGTSLFNSRFPFTRYEPRGWYGGHYGSNNDNHWVRFSAGGMDFIAIHLEYNGSRPAAVFDWARGLLRADPNRRGIVVAHSILNVGETTPWTAQGADIYEALGSEPNLFLMLCGHIHGENHRIDVGPGTVHTLLADYQKRPNGGNGWMRLLRFEPTENLVQVMTYSPTLDQWERDADSEFTIDYPMGGVPFGYLGKVQTLPGQAEAGLLWSGQPGPYAQWYATVSDGESEVAGPMREFAVGTARLDLNDDGGVNQADLELFLNCLTGPNQRYGPSTMPPGCGLPLDARGRLQPDWDIDGDLDQDDFGALQRCYVGAGQSAPAECFTTP